MRKWMSLFLLPLFVLMGCSGGGSDTASQETPAAEPAATGEAVEEAGQTEPPGETALSEPAAFAAPEPRRTTLSGMEVAIQVGEHLFGSQPTPEALAAIQAQGYKTVLTTRGEGELKWDEEQQVRSLGMKFVSIPMPNPIEAITDDQVDRFARLMNEGEPPMVLHCSSGNRVAGLWTVWLVERQGMDPEEALQLGTQAGMTRIRPIVEKRLAGK